MVEPSCHLSNFPQAESKAINVQVHMCFWYAMEYYF